jgi:molybdenum cofactor synthesis domain-containing protein
MLIGNELLSGKIEDLNASYLIKRLRELGATVERVVMVPDRFDDIEPELRALSERFDVVFTSGGVGPTHDDITLEAVARSFGRPLEQRAALLELVQGYFQEQLTDAHLRMTRVPKGTELLWGEDQRWPVFYVKNVYILPGVPRLFRAKFEQIAERFRCGTFTLRSLYLNAEEGLIAAHLARAEERFGVQIGSYPRFEKGVPYRVRVTVEARDEAPVIEAISWLRDTISSDTSLGAEVFVEVSEEL